MGVAMCWEDNRNPIMLRQLREKDLEIANLKEVIEDLKDELLAAWHEIRELEREMERMNGISLG